MALILHFHPEQKNHKNWSGLFQQPDPPGVLGTHCKTWNPNADNFGRHANPHRTWDTLPYDRPSRSEQ